VAEDSRSYALADYTLQGIWADTSERERRVLRKMRREAGVRDPRPCVNCGDPTIIGERCEPCRQHLAHYESELRVGRRASA
jgi:hypothetical protein